MQTIMPLPEAIDEAYLLRLDELLDQLCEVPLSPDVGLGTLESTALTAYRLHERLLRAYGVGEVRGMATSGALSAEDARALVALAHRSPPL